MWEAKRLCNKTVRVYKKTKRKVFFMLRLKFQNIHTNLSKSKSHLNKQFFWVLSCKIYQESTKNLFNPWTNYTMIIKFWPFRNFRFRKIITLSDISCRSLNNIQEKWSKGKSSLSNKESDRSKECGNHTKSRLCRTVHV